MFPIRHLLDVGVLTLAAVLTAPPLGHAQLTAARRYEACLASFEARVDEYWALHRRLERLVAPEVSFGDPHVDHAARLALADLLRAARPGAAEGDLFTPDVAEVFRVRIVHALRATGRTVAELRRAAEEDEWPGLALPVVHGAFDWRWDSVMWPSVIFALPPLPADLEYRFVGADLLLVDIHANLVVDILRGALPAD